MEGCEMQYLHAVLVRVPDGVDTADAAEEARRAALGAMERYGRGRVWDWREKDAGRYAERFPRRGVVLGCVERDLFLQLLEEWRQVPLERALKEAAWLAGEEWDWRPLEDIEPGGFRVFEHPDNGRNGLYWSARPVSWPESAKEMVRRLWNEPGLSMWAYRFTKAVQLAAGDYVSDSCFYSVPDGGPKISGETLRDARERPERYALVFLDLHN